MNLGEHIRRRRKMRGWSGAELARRAEISKSYLHAIETGSIAMPSFLTVMRLAWELDANPMTWWQTPEGEQFNAGQWDEHQGKAWARRALEDAIQSLVAEADERDVRHEQ